MNMTPSTHQRWLSPNSQSTHKHWLMSHVVHKPHPKPTTQPLACDSNDSSSMLTLCTFLPQILLPSRILSCAHSLVISSCILPYKCFTTMPLHRVLPNLHMACIHLAVLLFRLHLYLSSWWSIPLVVQTTISPKFVPLNPTHHTSLFLLSGPLVLTSRCTYTIKIFLRDPIPNFLYSHLLNCLFHNKTITLLPRQAFIHHQDLEMFLQHFFRKDTTHGINIYANLHLQRKPRRRNYHQRPTVSPICASIAPASVPSVVATHTPTFLVATVTPIPPGNDSSAPISASDVPCSRGSNASSNCCSNYSPRDTFICIPFCHHNHFPQSFHHWYSFHISNHYSYLCSRDDASASKPFTNNLTIFCDSLANPSPIIGANGSTTKKLSRKPTLHPVRKPTRKPTHKLTIQLLRFTSQLLQFTSQLLQCTTLWLRRSLIRSKNVKNELWSFGEERTRHRDNKELLARLKLCLRSTTKWGRAKNNSCGWRPEGSGPGATGKKVQVRNLCEIYYQDRELFKQ